MIKILLHYTSNWIDIADIIVPNLQEYADRHGYGLRVWEVSPYEKYTGWHKISMFNNDLEYGDIGLILDCDTLITNHNITIESFIDDVNDLYLSEGLNCGVMIVRKTDWSRIFFTMHISYGIHYELFHCEQDAIEHHAKNYPDKIKILPHPSINSYISSHYPHVQQPVIPEQGEWFEGAFILHVPSLGIENRIEILNQAKEKIVR